MIQKDDKKSLGISGFPIVPAVRPQLEEIHRTDNKNALYRK
jgi:hypothetical protein